MNRLTAFIAATLMASSPAVALAQSSSQPPQNQNKTPPATSTTSTGSDHSMKPQANANSMSDQKIKNVQSALDKRGEHVTVDGRWGPQTANAVRDFQKQNGLPSTGQLDHQTMQKLDIGQSG